MVWIQLARVKQSDCRVGRVAIVNALLGWQHCSAWRCGHRLNPESEKGCWIDHLFNRFCFFSMPSPTLCFYFEVIAHALRWKKLVPRYTQISILDHLLLFNSKQVKLHIDFCNSNEYIPGVFSIKLE